MSQAEEDPPRKVYGFKEREFKRDNATAKAGAPPSAKDLAKMAGAPVYIGRGGTTTAKAGDPNDVFTALEKNRAVEKKHGLDHVEIRKVKSKRKRDFWIALVGGNVIIIGGVILAGLNVVTVLFGFGGVIMFSLGLTWIMWQIMDRY